MFLCYDIAPHGTTIGYNLYSLLKGSVSHLQGGHGFAQNLKQIFFIIFK